MFFFFFFLPRGSFFSHLIIRLRMSVTLFTIPASFLVTKSRSNQGPFTTGSLHLCYFLLCDHCWFYVAFLSTWLLKWNLAFCALSRAATMMGLRATDKMYCCVMLLWLELTLLLPSPSVTIDILVSFPFCQPFVIRACFHGAFRSTKLFFCPLMLRLNEHSSMGSSDSAPPPGTAVSSSPC